MKDTIKKVIRQEYDDLMPSNFEQKVSSKVFQTILKPTPWYKQLRREDIVLVSVVALFVVFAYLIGFNGDYQISISLSKDLQKGLGMTICSISVGVYLFLNEYFERKKNIIQ